MRTARDDEVELDGNGKHLPVPVLHASLVDRHAMMSALQRPTQPQLMTHPSPRPPLAGLDIAYVDSSCLDAVLMDPHTLAVFHFGARPASAAADPRVIHVGLTGQDTMPLEVWRSASQVQLGRDNEVRWASDGRLELACIEWDEPDGEDIETAAEQTYLTLYARLARSPSPRLLRVWNYLDAITQGTGDDERYRRFCLGRARGMGTVDHNDLPAATCIGRYDGRRQLQVYWLSCMEPGTPIENPRQVSAYHYPRQYGPQSPSFARAMLSPASSQLPLLVSGTAAITGHESRHLGSVTAQLGETLANIRCLVDVARSRHPSLPAELGPRSPLKVYVRHAEDLPTVTRALETLLPADVPRIVLHAEVCRRELLVEIEGMHAP